jgi:hypothetical protein
MWEDWLGVECDEAELGSSCSVLGIVFLELAAIILQSASSTSFVRAEFAALMEFWNCPASNNATADDCIKTIWLHKLVSESSISETIASNH